MLTSAARPALVTHASRGRRLAKPPLLLLAACLAIALVGVGAARPAPALALSTLATRCDNVPLRSRPSTSSTRMATLSKGTRVVAVKRVSGGRWRSTCAGKTDTGRGWYKITVVNGKDVRSRFDVRAVYAASSLFRKLFSMSHREAACDGVDLRPTASTSGATKASLAAGTKVTVIGTVTGGSWSATCAGVGVSGSLWYKINEVNGKSTSSLYGVSAVYGAAGLFTGFRSVRVTSVPALLATLADNSVDEIVVANGTYRVSPSSQKATNSLWIGGDRYARRTRPITVRAETIGGVTFDAGGGSMGGLSFNGGSHDQTWDGFRFANGTTSQTGVIMFGGYAGLPAPYAITLRHITVDRSVHRVSNGTTDHAVYFSYALDTWRDIVIEDLSVDASDAMGLATAIHMDHGSASDAPNVPAHGVTVRRLTFKGNTSAAGQQAIILWKPPVRDWLFDGASIVNSGGLAVRFESIGAKNIVFKNITSTGSGVRGFYSSMGTNPPGVTLLNNSFH